MGLKIAMCYVFLVGVLVLLISGGEASVSYDHRAITVNGQRKILISGSIHYPRSTPEVYLHAQSSSLSLPPLFSVLLKVCFVLDKMSDF